MTSYIPGTTETDPKKQNRAIQQLGITSQKNQSDIATNASAISALQAGPLTSGNVASKSDQQTGTSAVLAVTPAHQQDHASAAKAWCLDNGAATPVASASFNISSLTDNGVGDTTFNFTTAMSSANYSVVALFQTSIPFTTPAATRSFDLISATASGVRLATGFWASSSGSGIDFPLRMAVFGAN